MLLGRLWKRTKHARQFIQNFYISVQRRTGMCLIGINLKRKEALLISGHHRNHRKETFLLNTNLQLKEK
jgi:hypothetical protein